MQRVEVSQHVQIFFLMHSKILARFCSMSHCQAIVKDILLSVGETIGVLKWHGRPGVPHRAHN